MGLKTFVDCQADSANGTKEFNRGVFTMYHNSRQEAIMWLKLSDYDLYELGFDKSDNSDDLRRWIKQASIGTVLHHALNS